MNFTRSMLLAALVASSASFATVLPAAAASGPATYADLTVQVRHDHDRYRDRDHHRWDRRSHRRRCYNDVDYRVRFGHRVRIIERICFDHRGRRYVASRRVVRVGHRW